jgi:hypothetical protein
MSNALRTLVRRVTLWRGERAATGKLATAYATAELIKARIDTINELASTTLPRGSEVRDTFASMRVMVHSRTSVIVYSLDLGLADSVEAAIRGALLGHLLPPNGDELRINTLAEPFGDGINHTIVSWRVS